MLLLEVKSLTQADADFCGDKAGLVLIPRGIGHLSCSSADQPGPGVTLCEAPGFCRPWLFKYLEYIFYLIAFHLKIPIKILDGTF